jgi:hypothetical protein
MMLWTLAICKGLLVFLVWELVNLEWTLMTTSNLQLSLLCSFVCKVLIISKILGK